MVDEWCGSEGALGVPPLVLQNVATVAQDPGGELFEAVVGRLSVCYAVRTRRQKEISREAEPVSPSRALVTMEGGDALNRAYECCRTYHTTSGPRATTGMHVHES